MKRNNIKNNVKSAITKYKNPLISIIVPVYDVEKYLYQCVDSILNQTLKNIEIILVNDGSPDNCRAICDDYARKDNRVIALHQENAGAPTALNLGIQKSKGDYIWFIDSDDFIEKESADKLYNCAIKNNVDTVLFSARIFSEIKPTKEQEDYWALKSVDLKYTKEHFSYEDDCNLLINLPTVPWNKLHKSEFIKSNQILFDTGLLAPYDAFFNLCCYLSGARIIFCNDILYNYRVTNTSTTARLVSDGSKKWNQPILLVQKTDELLKLKNIDAKYYPYFVNRTFRHCLYWLNRASGDSKSKFYKSLREYFNNLDRDIYTIENLKKSPYYKQYKIVCKRTYLYFILRKRINELFVQKVKNLKLGSKIKFPLMYIKKFNILRIIKSSEKNEIRLLGISLYKIKKYNNIKKKYILGVLIKRREIESLPETKILHNIQQNLKLVRNDVREVVNELYRIRTDIKVQTAHRYLATYKNKYKNKNIVILATGPSVKKYTPIKNSIHIGVNGATQFKKVKLDYLFVQDNAKESIMNENADKYDCIKFYGHHADDRAAKLYPDVKRITQSSRLKTNANIYLIEDKSFGKFAYDIVTEPFGDFHSTVFSALQFALYTNPRKIYLVGCDCSSGYFYDSTNPFYLSQNVLKGWEYFKNFKDSVYPDVKIISINPVGLKGVFKDIEM